jgi:bifunctional NMN adenylyltransferase/nudix hydrolase
MPTDIGVMVGRFQTPDLHEAHVALINTVCQKHKKCILFLGVARALVTQRNPLDFVTRKLMIQEKFSDLTILPLYDCQTNEEWVKQLDSEIRKVYPIGDVTLYGSRDSFIDAYKAGGGKLNCEELESKHFVAATDKRRECSLEIKGSRDFRHGVIYAAYNQYPHGFPTVDVAIVRDDKECEVLLCKKPNEPFWRFIGGFFDPRQDTSLECAARREAHEETGADVDGLEYICSKRVDDWRYRGEHDKIITTLFLATYISGRLEPNDDVAELKWFKVTERLEDQEDLVSLIMPVHKHLFEDFLNYLFTRKKKESACAATSS